MTFADLTVQGIDLEMAKCRIEGVVNDIEHLKVLVEGLLNDTGFTGDEIMNPGSRFRKLVMIKCLLNSAGIDAFGAVSSVRYALAYQQAALPQPEDIA